MTAKSNLPPPGKRPWPLCNAFAEVPYRDGVEIAYCSWFKGHKFHAQQNPLQHFDEHKRLSWVSEPPSSGPA